MFEDEGSEAAGPGEELVIDATGGERGSAEPGDGEAEALAALRARLLASEPAIPPELVSGDTVEELEASFRGAVALLARVRETVAAEYPPAIGGGAPGRATAEPGTPFERIREGLARLG